MALQKERYTPFLLFVVLVAILGGFLYGYHTGIIAGALVYLTPAFHLSIVQQGMVVSILLVSALICALFAGPLADKIGRKPTIALSALLFILGASILATSETYEMVLFGRSVSGLGIGLVSLAAPLYLAEVSPPQYQGTFVSAYQLAITIGILFSFFINYLFSSSADWRWMFAIGTFPALVQIIALFFIPETPSWLFKYRSEGKAVSTLKRLSSGPNLNHHIKEMERAASFKKTGAWKSVFSSKLRFVLLFGIALSSFQQITGINTVIYYAPKIFQTAGFASTTGAILATLGIGIINVCATIFSVWLLDRVGRRRLLLVGIAGMILTLSLLSLAFFMHTAWIDKIAIISLMGYVSFFAIGLGPVTWVLISEIYPMRARGKAMTIAVFFNWLCNYIVSLTFLDLIEKWGAHGAFFTFAITSAFAFWFIFRYAPETKGKSLEEIESLLVR